MGAKPARPMATPKPGIQDQFGQSAPYERLLAINGITVENIVAQAKAIQ